MGLWEKEMWIMCFRICLPLPPLQSIFIFFSTSKVMKEKMKKQKEEGKEEWKLRENK